MSILASIIVITNIGFTVAYDTDVQGPCWCDYEINRDKIVKAERPSFSFKRDERVSTNDVITMFLGYDRGHLAPAADFQWNQDALRQTFLMSNVCPMSRKLNRGEWRKTEDEVRKLAQSNTVKVIIWAEYDCGKIPTAFNKVAYGGFGIRYWRFLNDK